MKFRFTGVFLILVALCLGLGSCVNDDRGPTPEPSRALLVYVGVDNNLSGYEVEKIRGIRSGWSGKATDRIFVYVDKAHSGATLYELSVDRYSDAPVIANYGYENSASGEVFARAVGDMLKLCPGADSYGLLIFSHASGWLPAGALNDPRAVSATSQYSRSIIVDGNSQMELADFARSIPDHTFDYIAFEACFMAGVEVAYELRDKSPLILASSAEIVHPGFAPVYESAIGKLMGLDLPGFGESAFRHILTYARSDSRRSATYSVIRTAGIPALATFVRENCDFSRDVDIAVIQHFDRQSYHLFFDFEDYYGRLLPSDALRSEFAQLVADCVEWKADTGVFMAQSGDSNGFTITNHSGLTAYIPQSSFPGLNEVYKQLGWSQTIRIP